MVQKIEPECLKRRLRGYTYRFGGGGMSPVSLTYYVPTASTQPHQLVGCKVQWTPLTTNNYYYHVRLQYSTFKLIWPDYLTPFVMIS